MRWVTAAWSNVLVTNSYFKNLLISWGGDGRYIAYKCIHMMQGKRENCDGKKWIYELIRQPNVSCRMCCIIWSSSQHLSQNSLNVNTNICFSYAMDHKTFFQFSLLSTTKTTFINIKLIEWKKKCIKIDMYKNKN